MRHGSRKAKRGKPKQTEMRFRTWGGKRKGAGRKPNGPRPGVPHLKRPELKRRTPVHVTLRVADHDYNLRSRRSLRVIARALHKGADRFEVAVVQFSVQGNHLHLLVEASSTLALSRAIKGLSVRIARRMNEVMGRSGRVMGDRYHAHVLRTPTEVRRIRHYIAQNHRQHLAERGERVPSGWVDPYSSELPVLGALLPRARTWLVREGWRRGRLPPQQPS